MRNVAAWVVTLVGVLGAGCAHQPLWSVMEGADNIVAMQKSLEMPGGGLEKVMILRLVVDGQRLEVTSLGPTVIVAEAARGNRTIFNLGGQKFLTLFTRDGKNIRGYRLDIPVGDLLSGKEFRFPVAQDSGDVVEKRIVIDRLIIQ